ncbi:hypothetical protein D3C85_1669420 [compost metagenome]
MRPAGHDLYIKPARAQRSDPFGRRIAFAAQHQLGLETPRLPVRRDQIHRHLGGAGKAAGHEMQHARPARCLAAGRSVWSIHAALPAASSWARNADHRMTTQKT